MQEYIMENAKITVKVSFYYLRSLSGPLGTLAAEIAVWILWRALGTRDVLVRLVGRYQLVDLNLEVAMVVVGMPSIFFCWGEQSILGHKIIWGRTLARCCLCGCIGKCNITELDMHRSYNVRILDSRPANGTWWGMKENENLRRELSSFIIKTLFVHKLQK